MVLKLVLNIVTLQLRSQAREQMPIQITKRVVDVAEVKRENKRIEVNYFTFYWMIFFLFHHHCILSSFIYSNLFNIILFFFALMYV
jgi:hypothetical protein